MKCINGTEACPRGASKHDTCTVHYSYFDPVHGAAAVKKDEGKYDPTMLSVEMVELVSRVRMFGAKKYSRGNWKRGFKYTRSLAVAMRHILAFLGGENNDPESGLSHLGHAICSIEHCVYDTIHHPENDDRKD